MINIQVTLIYTPLPFSVYYDRLSICIPYLQGFQSFIARIPYCWYDNIYYKPQTHLFNSLMVFLASPLLRKYPIIFDITDETDLSSSSAISLRKSSLSLVVLNDKKESFFIVKIYNKVWHIMTILNVWQLLTFYNLWLN